MDEIFKRYYETNFWHNPESVSGAGSTLDATKKVRTILSTLLPTMGITSLLDISCGDFHWFNEVAYGRDDEKFEKYIGADIVPELIAANRKRYIKTYLEFQVLDAVKDQLPEVDMIFCRDTLVHFTNRDIEKTIKNFRASGSKYLMATTFPGANPNQDIQTGQWRPTDLSALRYGLGPPGMVLIEGLVGEFQNKSLGLWRLN